ncbi:sentrin-specific protease 5 [Eucyclogobius newberryi]|uniref:sentrin-specific protease 5 n=1 Tax=Eucyclogobius newberryi TaxID=166745 RepID=UPI003B5A6963
MVHSGFSSPMNTTSALPLPASTTAPPVVPPSAEATEQTLPQTLIKLTPNSDSTNVSTPFNDTSINNEASSVLSTLTPTPAQPVVNGRTSGRKRTPKSCDCCGPKGHGHGHGHNVQTPNRGRGRARGRARGRESALEETPKRTGGLLTYTKSFDLTNDNLVEVEGTKMGADSPSQNSTEIPVPDHDGLAVNSVSSDIKNIQNKKFPIAKGSVNNNDIEMKVLDKPVDVVQSSPVMGPTLLTTTTTTTPGEIKRKNDDNALCSSTNVQVPSKANKQAKLEQEEQTDRKSLSQNGELIFTTNGLQCSKNDVSETVTNGPLLIGTKPGDSSAVDLTLIDQTCENTNSLNLTLSNGTTPTDDTQEVMGAMGLETSKPPAVPPPPQDPIAVSMEEHLWALRDHRMYCRLGTWDRGDQAEESSGERLDDGSQEAECEQLVDIIHEFLESFYIKYGSFIPLAENDVVEHLKKKGKSDLTNKGLDIQKEVKRYRAGLASAPVAGFMVTHNRHTLSLDDLSTLEEQNWINDQIINMYGELIMEATEQKVHFFNSFFHKQLVAKGYEGVKRWTKKIDLFSKWLVLIPIHLEIHWSLVTVSMAHKTISYYDSQGIVFRHTTENIMKYLLAEAKEKKQTAFQKGWKITIIKGIPQQKNDSDCGVFVLEYCRCLSVKQPFRFSQEDMPRIRKRIYKELCECRLDV